MSAAPHDPSRRKVPRARIVATSPMVCPSCAAVLAEPVEQCPRCSFSGHVAVSHFPFAAPALDRCLDPKHHLPDPALFRIAGACGDLEERFPQVRISSCLIDLSPDADLREFGFWLLNASPVRDEREATERPWTVLLVIDDRNGRASVTAGYAIEPFLSDANLESLLRSESRQYLARDYGSAILRFIEGIGEILEREAAGLKRGIRRGLARTSRNDWRKGSGR